MSNLKMPITWASLLLTLLLSPAAMAQTVPVEHFASHAEVRSVSLSPTGSHVAMAVPAEDGEETQLQVISLADGATQVLRFAKRQHVTDPVWTADDQVTVARARMEPLRAKPYSLGELMSSRIDGTNRQVLFAYIADDGTKRGQRKDEGFAEVVKVLDHEPGMALVSYACWNCGEVPDSVVFKVDTRTGKRAELERLKGRARFIFDHHGNARVAIALDENDNPTLLYRPKAKDDWQPLPGALAGYIVDSGTFDADNDTLYATISDEGEPSQLYRLKLSDGTREKLSGRTNADVAYVLRAGRNGPPFAAVYDAAKPSIDYLEPSSEWAQLHAGLMKSFPAQMVRFIDFSRDNSQILFLTYSDRHPGAYYILDRSRNNAVRLVSEVNSRIQPSHMSPTRPIEFTSRHGESIAGFLTSKGGPRPLVVLPHGGPHGVYDRWGYDDDVQFLASRGYAVLQVNFRGSGGRGKNFEEAGWREWGGKIQDDIADGVHWAIENQHAIAGQACIFGASFGAYAALMNPIRHTGLYRCAVGYAGLYDLEVMHEEGDIRSHRAGRRYLERVIGSDIAHLRENSPTHLVDRLNVPVLLIHGKLDRRTPLEQLRAMERSLKRAGNPSQSLVIASEGHGFYAPENRAEAYRRIEAFLGQHLAPAAN